MEREQGRGIHSRCGWACFSRECWARVPDPHRVSNWVSSEIESERMAAVEFSFSVFPGLHWIGIQPEKVDGAQGRTRGLRQAFY